MAMVKCPECEGSVSDLAEVCPHCGYPLKKKDAVKTEYVLSKGRDAGSGFANFLAVLAWIVWIGGLIVSISGALVIEKGYYSSTTHFSFTTFLTLFLSYVVYGILLMGMASIVDKITATYNIVSGLSLDRIKAGPSDNTGKKGSQQPPVPLVNEWICPACKHANNSWDYICAQCGEPKSFSRNK